jgi:hypothetical protein
MPYQTISQRPAAPRQQGQASPGYVSYSRILDANRPGAKRMADQLAGNVQQQGQQVQQAIQGAGEDFSKKVKAGTLSYSNPLNTTRGPAMAQGGGYAQAGAMLGPQANANNREYKGPKDWEGAGINTQGLATQAAQAGAAAQGLTSMGGRAAQLRQQARGPYGAGMSALDAALAGSGLGGRGQDLAAMYGNLSQQLIDRRAAGGKEVEGAIEASNTAYGNFEADAKAWDQMSQPQAPVQAPYPTPTSLPPPNVDGVVWDWDKQSGQWVPTYP